MIQYIECSSLTSKPLLDEFKCGLSKVTRTSIEPYACVQETEIKGSKSGDRVISRSASRFEDSDYDSDCVRTCSEPSIVAIVDSTQVCFYIVDDR